MLDHRSLDIDRAIGAHGQMKTSGETTPTIGINKIRHNQRRAARQQARPIEPEQPPCPSGERQIRSTQSR